MPDSTKAAHNPKHITQLGEPRSINQLYLSAHAGVAYLDAKLSLLSANKMFSKAMGLDETNLHGRHISTFVNDAAVLRAVEIAVEECRPSVLYSDNHSTREHLRTLWQWSINPIRNGDAHVEGVLVHLVDLTECTPQLANPPQTEMRLHNIVHSAPLILCAFDRNGQILVCEGSELEKLGYVADDLVGRNIHDLIPHRQDIHQLLERALAGEIFQTELTTSTGEVYAAHFQAYQNAHNKNVGVICNALNISNNVKYKQELQRSEERFRTSIENMYDPFVLFSTIRDEQGKITDFVYEYANQAALKANGMSNDNLIGRRLLEMMPKHLETGLFDKYCRVVETGEPLILEDLYYEDSIDGFPIGQFFDVRATRLEDKLAYTWRNVTERKLHQDKLVRQQRLLETVLEALPVGIWLVDSKGEIIKSNPAGREIWGGDTFVRKNDRGKQDGYDPTKPIEEQDCPIAQAVLHGKPSLDEIVEIESFQGIHKIIQNSVIPIRDSNDAITGAVVVDHDITQLKQVEKELIEVKHQLQNSIERERMKLAKELHDGPLQTLLAASYMLEDRDGLPASSTSVAEAQQIILDVIDRLRVIYGKLRPVTVAHYGLVKAMRFLLAEFKKKHPDLTIHQEFEDKLALPELSRLILFRSFRQLLDNIEQHSNAQTISVRLRTDDHWVILEVNDDGSGFTFPGRWVDFAHEGHLGLLETKESIEAIGGYLMVDSTPNEGTRVRILVRRFINQCTDEMPGN